MRSCAVESGMVASSVLVGMTSQSLSRAWLARDSLSCATVGSSNSMDRDRSIAISLAIREISCDADSECPPKAKKLSWMPTCSTRSTSANNAASRCSASLRGATYSCACTTCGAGSANRSNLPLDSRGNCSSHWYTVGSM